MRASKLSLHSQSTTALKYPRQKKKKKIYLPNESHIKLNQINAKGGLPEEQTLIKDKKRKDKKTQKQLYSAR